MGYNFEGMIAVDYNTVAKAVENITKSKEWLSDGEEKAWKAFEKANPTTYFLKYIQVQTSEQKLYAGTKCSISCDPLVFPLYYKDLLSEDYVTMYKRLDKWEVRREYENLKNLTKVKSPEGKIYVTPTQAKVISQWREENE